MSGDRRPLVWFFLGPTLSRAEFDAAAASIDGDVRVFPPIQQGDLLREPFAEPDIIAIVDGYFFQVPSVSHKEILLALERGARVLGSSSLGALRAAELHTFGMEGVGRIYELYQKGTIDGDDEVAVSHFGAETGFRSLTEPLVNLRHNLGRARARGLISGATAATVLAAGRALHFTRRTSEAALDQAEATAPREELAALRAFLGREAVDLKRRDALALVELVADRLAGRRPWPDVAPVTTNQTVYLHLFRRAYAGRRAPGGDPNAPHVADSLVLSLHTVLSPSYPSVFRRMWYQCLAVDEARHQNLAGAEVGKLVAEFRRAEALVSDEGYRGWLRAHLMAAWELGVTLHERDLARRLLARYDVAAAAGASDGQPQLVWDVANRLGVTPEALRGPLFIRPGIPWEAPIVRELKFTGQFGPALEAASRILAANARIAHALPGFARALSTQRLEEWLAERWGVSPTDLDEAVLARGVSDHRELLEAARLAYVHERAGAEDEPPRTLPIEPSLGG